MIYTGVDGDKTFSVDYSPFKKSWKRSERTGKKIYAVPSDKSLVRIEETDLKDIYDLKRFLSIEIEEKFGEVLWDVKLTDGKYCLALVKDFEPPNDTFAYEPEVLSLARFGKATGLRDGFILDIGRRKTTLIMLEDGEFRWFRVVLKGGDFVDSFVGEALGISPEEARSIKHSEGLENEKVRGAYKTIIEHLGQDLRDREVLLSGGGAKARGLEALVGNVAINNSVPLELSTAFGASLKFVLRDCAPDFREEELSGRELKRVALILGLSTLLFMGANLSLNFVEKEVTKRLRNMEKEAFKDSFPELPAVAVRDQVKSMLREGGYELTSKLIELSSKLRSGIEIYKLEYKEGKLKVVGATKDEKVATNMRAKSIKKTPEGGYEFEVEVE